MGCHRLFQSRTEGAGGGWYINCRMSLGTAFRMQGWPSRQTSLEWFLATDRGKLNS